MHYHKYINNTLNINNYIKNNKITNINNLKSYLLEISQEIENIKKTNNKEKIQIPKYNYIFGHTKGDDKLNKNNLFNIYLDNRMSKFKYNSKFCLNNCYNMYLTIHKNNHNVITISKINNYNKIYNIYLINNKLSLYFNKKYYYMNKINNKQKLILQNNIKDILKYDVNILLNKINNLEIEEYKYISQDIINNISLINKKLNIYYYINNKETIIDMDLQNYILDENLNIVGIMKITELKNIINGGSKNFYSNNINNDIIIKDNYKLYIKDCIENYNYLNKLLIPFDYKNNCNFNFNNIYFKKIIIEIYKLFFNNILTDEDINNYNNITNENEIKNNIIFKRINYLINGIEEINFDLDIKDGDKINEYKKINFMYIIIKFYLNIFEEEIYNKDLIMNCDNLALCINYPLVSNDIYKYLINRTNILLNQLKEINKQQNQLKFIENNMYFINENNNNKINIKYISPLNIYCLYYIYNLNISNDLNNEIKLLLVL